MRTILRTLAVLFVLTIPAFANSISLTNLSATFSLGPNFGSGDNLLGSFSGPGLALSYIAGTNWFFSLPAYAPGSVFPTTGLGIFPDFAKGTVDSQSVLSLGAFTFDLGAFKFPTTISSSDLFTVTIPAFLGPIHGETSTGMYFTLGIKPGDVTLTFDYSNGLYYPVSGSFSTVPEPGTWLLVATGFALPFWKKAKRKKDSAQ